MGNIGFSAILSKQIPWSEKTFGEGDRTEGIVKHIKKELDEVLADFYAGKRPDIPEWIDVLILTVDALWRMGYTPLQILGLYHDKMEINYLRKWNKPIGINKPIEHVREPEPEWNDGEPD